MKNVFYKYHGAGNDFLMADGRDCGPMDPVFVSKLCDRHLGFGADGLILVRPSDKASFRMEYFNSDGSTGMMCGNGGRCIVAFADRLGYEKYDFEAADGIHEGEILSREGDVTMVRISMKDVTEVRNFGPDYFMDTGTRHFVKFVKDVADVDLVSEALPIRHSSLFAPIGTNVNFVSEHDGCFHVRTFEKGVEAETLACGTGIVATAIAAHMRTGKFDNQIYTYKIKAAVATLEVSFLATTSGFKNIHLTGPAEFVGIVEK